MRGCGGRVGDLEAWLPWGQARGPVQNGKYLVASLKETPLHNHEMWKDVQF